MKYRFIAFHTMTRGSEKPSYVVDSARLLAETGARVMVLDGLMYEQGTVPHRIFQTLGAAPVLEDGKNLYDLICDYETLCAGRDFPGAECNRSVLEQLGFPVTRRYRGGLLPDVCGRVSPLPNREKIAFLPGSNGNVVEVRRRIDFQTLFERHSGYAFFQYVAEELARQFELILLSAPAGHQEISGILCGQMADLILAIDLDSPAMESNPSYEACMQLARQVRSSNGRRIDVKSVRGQPPEEVVQMILKSHENAG